MASVKQKPLCAPYTRRMKTAFLLMAQYDGLAVIPVEYVCRDYFRHLPVEKFLRKVLAGKIALPIARTEGSQKKGIQLTDLAAYIDRRCAIARAEMPSRQAGVR